ncbi:hypothetical protein COY95_01015, partial [Candidatus Woesearchaeota archaeon CG_4_10_14_0_8_um_filter_47_5]
RKSVVDEFMVPLMVQTRQCPHCSRQGSMYFEAIVQMKTGRKEIHAFFEERVQERTNKGMCISKKMPVKESVHYYLTGQRHLRGIMQQLVDRFGGEIVVSKKLFSEDHLSSRNVYRVTVLYRPPEFQKGSVILYNNRAMRVAGLGKTALLEDLETGATKKIAHYMNHSMNHMDLPLTALPVFPSTITKVRPHPEVLHPETYQSVRAGNASLPGDLRPGQTVDVVMWEEKVFIVQD